jgi:type VI secretion system secreted protein Hcp
MALNMYLKIGDIEGESTDQAHEGWIDVLSVSQSVTQPSSALASSGRRTSQRVIMQDFSVVKTIDKATPKLYLACCSGQRIPTVEIHLVTTGPCSPT